MTKPHARMLITGRIIDENLTSANTQTCHALTGKVGPLYYLTKKPDERNYYPAPSAMVGRSKSTILITTSVEHVQQVEIAAKDLTVPTTTVKATGE